MSHKYKKMRKGHFSGDGSWFQASIYNGSRDNCKNGAMSFKSSSLN